MNIYFAGSIKGGRGDKELYAEIIHMLGVHGTVLTEHLGSNYITDAGEKHLTKKEVYDRDISWLTESDVVVAEVSTPSLGVGYEVCKAEELNKPTLCLFRSIDGRSISAMIGGAPKVKVVQYNDKSELPQIFKDFFATIK